MTKTTREKIEKIIQLAMSCDTARGSPLGWKGDYRDEEEIKEDLVDRVLEECLKN